MVPAKRQMFPYRKCYTKRWLLGTLYILSWKETEKIAEARRSFRSFVCPIFQAVHKNKFALQFFFERFCKPKPLSSRWLLLCSGVSHRDIKKNLKTQTYWGPCSLLPVNNTVCPQATTPACLLMKTVFSLLFCSSFLKTHVSDKTYIKLMS